MQEAAGSKNIQFHVSTSKTRSLISKQDSSNLSQFEVFGQANMPREKRGIPKEAESDSISGTQDTKEGRICSSHPNGAPQLEQGLGYFSLLL